jgi:hypothetical protein
MNFMLAALRDRAERRACSLTDVTGGVVEAWYWPRSRYMTAGTQRFRAVDAVRAANDAIEQGAAYRVFYACHSGRLASAERVDEPLAVEPLARYQLQLAAILRFDPGSLEANRQGRFGGEQLAAMLAKVLGMGLAAAVLFWVAAALGGAVKLDKQLPLLARVALGLTGLGLGALVVASAQRTARDLVRGPCALEGTLDKFHVVSTGRTKVAWRIEIDGRGFRGPTITDDAGGDLVRIGQPHRAYYGCVSRTLLSLEAMPTPTEPAQTDK